MKGSLLNSAESHFAREAFPSVDEPEAKATFDLSFEFDQEEGEIAPSNMPEIDVETAKKQEFWEFAMTPRMSSSLPLLLEIFKDAAQNKKWHS